MSDHIRHVILTEIHPRPWRVVEDHHFAEALPFTILDANSRSVGAAASSAIYPGSTPWDEALARLIVDCVNDAPLKPA